MIKNLILILLLLISNLLFAQEWMEPVNISNMGGSDRDPDITIGGDGTLHCVWEHTVADNFRKIYYSFSTDEGNTWSAPLDVSQNDTLWMNDPHIVCDSQDTLYVTYEYNTYSSPIVVMQKFDGITWSKIDTVVYGYSHHNKIFIDNNDRVYVFYSQGDSKIHYKYLENDIWSDSITPFDIDDFNSVSEVVVDQNNYLHIIGHYQYLKAYYKYDPVLDQWDSPVILSDNTYQYEGSDIAVDNNNQPYAVWHESWSETEDFEHATFYSFNNGTNWSSPELISENSYSQQITSVNDKIFLMDAKSEPNDKMSMVLYQQDAYGNWYGNKFFLCDGFNGLKMFFHENKLFIIFYWFFDDVNLDISIMKTKYGVGINEIEDISTIFILNQNYPNPFSENTKITYKLKQAGYCTLAIYNTEGKLMRTLVSEKKTQGTYNIDWNGRNSNGEKLPAGIYYYRFSFNNYQLTKSLIIN